MRHLLLFSILLNMFFISIISAQEPGAFVESFGVDGIAITDFGKVLTTETAFDTLYNGGYVVAGQYISGGEKDVGITMFTPEGGIDLTFGTDGLVVIDGYGYDDFVASIHIQDDEKILVAGTALKERCTADNLNSCETDFFLFRLNVDGELDNEFGANGVVLTDFEENEVCGGMRLLDDRKILIAGTTKSATGEERGILVRYNTDGTVDATFGEEGKVKLALEHSCHFNDFDIQADGKIIVVGEGDNKQMVARFHPNGDLDENFGNDGWVLANQLYEGRKIALQPDGGIIAMGMSGYARYKISGDIDSTLNDDGVVFVDIPICGGSGYQFNDIALLPDNGVVIAANYNDFYDDYLIVEECAHLLKFNSHGDLVGNFGDSGIKNLGCESEFVIAYVAAQANNILVTSDGRLNVVVRSCYVGDENLEIQKLYLSGNIDESFGTNGKAIFPNLNSTVTLYDMALRDDGKILVTGYNNEEKLMLLQYTENGNLDVTFGENGVVSTYISNVDIGRRILIKSNGRILLFGEYYDGGVIIQYLPNGDIDATFGTEGKVLIPTNDASLILAEIQDDGKIVVVFHSDFGGSVSQQKILRYNADGSLDETFGTNGLITHPLAMFVNSFVLQPDGKMITLGYKTISGLGEFMIISRINVDGSLDVTFADEGKIMEAVDFPSRLITNQILLMPDGKILSGGSNYNSVVVTKYDIDGNPDPLFGEAGRVQVPVADIEVFEFSNLVVQPDGKILVIGYAGLEESFHYGHKAIVARFTRSGELDPSFGDNGMVENDFFVETTAGVIATDNAVLVGGYLGILSAGDIIIGKFHLGQYTEIHQFTSIVKASLFPNPTKKQATLTYFLEREEQISLRLYDMFGRLVQTFYTAENKITGEHQEKLFFDKALVPGQYFLTFSTKKKRFSLNVQLF